MFQKGDVVWRKLEEASIDKHEGKLSANRHGPLLHK